MPPMDYSQFEKWLKKNGYTIGHSTKHHVVLDKQGLIVARFAVAHKAGSKRYIKAPYVALIQKIIQAK